MFSDFGVIIRVFYKFYLILSISILAGLFTTPHVSAEEFKPACNSAVLNGDNLSTTFSITLNCNDFTSFYNGEISLTQDLDLMNMQLHTGSGTLTPLRVDIINTQIVLTFYSWDDSYIFYDLSTRDLTINSDLIVNTTVMNDVISFTTGTINDKALPASYDDSYDVISEVLDVKPDKGVFSNDIEKQSSSVGIYLESNVSYGTLVLNSDGSFIYNPSAHFWDEAKDSFTYSMVQQSGERGNIVTVTLANSPPDIETDFYEVCESCNTEIAKNGDMVKVEVTSTKPIILSDMYIAGQNISEYTISNPLRYYFTYVLGSNVDSEDVVVNDNINYSFKYTYATIETPYNKEDTIILDNIPPVISLNDDEYIELYIGDIYEEAATAYDDVSGDTPVNVVGFVDTTKGGLYELYYTSTDEAGNISEVAQKTIYVIDEIAPIITINQIDNLKRGETLVISGYIDDVTCAITLDIEGKIFNVPSDNISSNRWYMRFNTDNFKLGKNVITVTAIDEFDNSTSATTSFVVSERPAVPINYEATIIPVVKYTNHNYGVEDSVDITSQTPNNQTSTDQLQDVKVEVTKPINNVFDWSFLGIDWYYWLMMTSVLALLLFWIFGK